MNKNEGSKKDGIHGDKISRLKCLSSDKEVKVKRLLDTSFLITVKSYSRVSTSINEGVLRLQDFKRCCQFRHCGTFPHWATTDPCM